jgi:hypothetical protein
MLIVYEDIINYYDHLFNQNKIIRFVNKKTPKLY